VLQFFTGGYYKPTIHHIVQPPEDRCNYGRLGAFYITMPGDNVRLLLLVKSLVLVSNAGGLSPLCGTRRKGRTTMFGRTDFQKGKEHNSGEEVIEDAEVKHYDRGVPD
jgi:hypothetical protein